MKKLRIFVLLLLPVVIHAQDIQYSYSNRREIVADVCPHMKLSKFGYGNEYSDRAERFKENFTWENIGTKDIEAFELVVLKYNPFNEQVMRSRILFPGHNSARYAPLKPKEVDADGTTSLGSEDVFTGVLYVRAIRFTDGTIWRANPADVLSSIKKQVPDLLEPGKLVPDPKKG